MDLNIGEHYLANLFGLDVNLDTLVTLWAAMALILFFAILATVKINIVPTKLQSVFEKIVTFFVGLTEPLGKEQGTSALVLMCIFLLIIVSNILGQFPFKLLHLESGELASPTNDINTTAALAVFVLLYYIGKGIYAHGLSYFKHYVQPVWFMTPFNIMEDFIRPLTLSIRLFANVLAGEVMITILGGLIFTLKEPIMETLRLSGIFGGDFILLIGSLMSLPVMLFELFVATIQALLFTLLANAYIQGAVIHE